MFCLLFIVIFTFINNEVKTEIDTLGYIAYCPCMGIFYFFKEMSNVCMQMIFRAFW